MPLHNATIHYNDILEVETSYPDQLGFYDIKQAELYDLDFKYVEKRP